MDCLGRPDLDQDPLQIYHFYNMQENFLASVNRLDKAKSTIIFPGY
jgi:hypothetical protein